MQGKNSDWSEFIVARRLDRTPSQTRVHLKDNRNANVQSVGWWTLDRNGQMLDISHQRQNIAFFLLTLCRRLLLSVSLSIWQFPSFRFSFAMFLLSVHRIRLFVLCSLSLINSLPLCLFFAISIVFFSLADSIPCNHITSSVSVSMSVCMYCCCPCVCTSVCVSLSLSWISLSISLLSLLQSLHRIIISGRTIGSFDRWKKGSIKWMNRLINDGVNDWLIDPTIASMSQRFDWSTTDRYLRR